MNDEIRKQDITRLPLHAVVDDWAGNKSRRRSMLFNFKFIKRD